MFGDELLNFPSSLLWVEVGNLGFPIGPDIDVHLWFVRGRVHHASVIGQDEWAQPQRI